MSEDIEEVGKESLGLYLPYPPSINHYYGRRGNVSFLTQKGKDFRAAVTKAIEDQSGGIKFESDMLSMTVMYFPPDNRKRDLDNPRKPLQDALMKAGLFSDDSQIFVATEMKSPIKSKKKGGYCYVVIAKLYDGAMDNMVTFDERAVNLMKEEGKL